MAAERTTSRDSLYESVIREGLGASMFIADQLLNGGRGTKAVGNFVSNSFSGSGMRGKGAEKKIGRAEAKKIEKEKAAKKAEEDRQWREDMDKFYKMNMPQWKKDEIAAGIRDENGNVIRT